MNQFAGYIENEIGSLKDSNENLMTQVENDIKKQLGESIKVIKAETRDYIRELDSMKERATERYEKFFNQWKPLYYLVIVNLVTTPIISIIALYLYFFKN